MSRTRPETKTVRCAIYTRKSTEEGLDQEFNSLDAQRESAEAYIASQRHEGWKCLPARYDDGGFTGGNMDRPALRRLLADIEAGLIDAVITYKVDRLSRSLLDFSRILEVFERRGVSFVSVTQAFNTTSSMGRLTLNILLSFAQFEREIISERTRDKMAAARRKGQYLGGAPVLGYDVDRKASKLIVCKREAVRVREIFELYLAHEALLPTIAELDRRGWTTKRWATKAGTHRGGKPFNKTSLYALLTNVTYVGKVRYKAEIHEGQHDAIVEPAVFERVQKLLRRNHRTGGSEVRNKYGALLKGLLRCAPCGCAMSHSHSTKDGHRRYRYYVCTNAQKRGWANGPLKSVPAAEIEAFVVDQIRAVGRDPALVAATLAQVRAQVAAGVAELRQEQHGVEQDVAQANREMRAVVAAETLDTHRMADLNERVRLGELRLAEIRAEIDRLEAETIDEADVADALGRFDPVWEQLSTNEQARLIGLLVERVAYDGADGSVAVTFRPRGIRELSDELQVEETAA